MGRKIAWVSFDDIGRDCMLSAAKAGAEVAAVVTLPEDIQPKPSGWCSFAEAAGQVGADVITTTDVNSSLTVEALRRRSPEFIFVVGWSQLVREELLSIASAGVFGMHPTLLPKHRGRAPIPWAILSGLTTTGVTMFEILDPSADSGDVVGRVEVPIATDETAATLYAKVARAHLELVEAFLPPLLEGIAPRVPQDESRASEWPKRRPRDGIIDWDSRLVFLDAWIRAQTRPYPGAFTYHRDAKMIVWRARPLHTSEGEPAGTIVRSGTDGIEVRCGDGVLLLEEVEMDGLGILSGSRIGEHAPEGTVLG
jgi:methionyl-tRNA formyltransferase